MHLLMFLEVLSLARSQYKISFLCFSFRVKIKGEQCLQGYVYMQNYWNAVVALPMLYKHTTSTALIFLIILHR